MLICRKTQTTYLKCLDCEGINVIQRKFSKKKKKGHIKDLYCHICKKITKQIEQSEF